MLLDGEHASVQSDSLDRRETASVLMDKPKHLCRSLDGRGKSFAVFFIRSKTALKSLLQDSISISHLYSRRISNQSRDYALFKLNVKVFGK